MSPAEKEMWDDLPLDSLDEEIRMCRIWLARAGALDYAISQDSNSTANLTGFALTEIRRSSNGMVTATDAISKRPDLWARKDRLLGRLAQLVKTRAELIAAAQASTDNVDDKARQIRDALVAIVDLETKPVDVPDDAVDDEEGDAP